MFGIRVKLLVFAALVWAVIFGLYGAYVYYEKVDSTKSYGMATATILAEQIMADREYYAANVAEGAMAAGLMGHSHSLIPPHATTTRANVKDIITEQAFFVDFLSAHPINRSKTPTDVFEIESLKLLALGDKSSFQVIEDYKGLLSVRLLVPDFATSRACVACHNAHPESVKRDFRLGELMGALEVVVPIEAEMKAAMADIQRAIAYGFIIIAVMGLAGLTFLSRVVTNPIQSLAETTSYLASGDLTHEAEIKSSDEIGRLAKGTNEVVRNIHGAISGIRKTSDEAVEIAAMVRETGRQMVEGSYIQATSFDSITSAMEKINTSIAEIARGTTVLADSTERGQASVSEIGATISDVATGMEMLFGNVNDTAASTKRTGHSIKEISESIGDLTGALDQLSNSLVEVNTGVKEVESHSAETTIIAEDVIEDARSGMASVERTIEGMGRTRDITHEASGVVEHLSERISEIGKIVDVIRNVSEETNLLALNAAIIATKAGEQGRSFSVVANEITELAERTSTSTKEVAKIIETVEIETERAVSIMKKGFHSAEEGAALGVGAGKALKEIVDSAERSNEMVRRIAKVASQQSLDSRQAVEAAERVVSTTGRIVVATEEQAHGAELIDRAIERMQETARRVKETTGEQVEANKKITTTMEEVSRMVSKINSAVQEQKSNSEKILHAIEAVREVSIKNIDKAKEGEEAVGSLARLNRALMESVRHFKLKSR